MRASWLGIAVMIPTIGMSAAEAGPSLPYRLPASRVRPGVNPSVAVQQMAQQRSFVTLLLSRQSPWIRPSPGLAPVPAPQQQNLVRQSTWLRPWPGPAASYTQAVQQLNLVNLLLSQENLLLGQVQRLIQSQTVAFQLNALYGSLRDRLMNPSRWLTQAIASTAQQVNRYQAMINPLVVQLQNQQVQIRSSLALADQLSRGQPGLQTRMAVLSQRSSLLESQVQVIANRPAKTPIYPG